MSKFYRNKKGFLATLTKGSGLYLTLGATALIVVCFAALLFSPESEDQSVQLPSDTAPAVTNPVTEGSPSTNSDEVQSPSTSDSAVNAPVEDPKAEPVEDVTMILPVSGTVGTDFSLTVPVFSETMNDWRVHQGIDYLTDGPVDVVAAADGIVEQVYTGELMGLTVEILHKDGTISVYQSLSGEAEVIAGQEVRQGDVIGKTGTSADCECLMGNHLHFALIREGVYLDPEDRYAS